MATGTIIKIRDMVGVPLKKENVTLTVNQTNGNSVDFTSLVSSNTPSGYNFHHLEYVGAWPGQTWNNAIVSLMKSTESMDAKGIVLTTTATQTYSTIRVIAWYYR